MKKVLVVLSMILFGICLVGCNEDETKNVGKFYSIGYMYENKILSKDDLKSIAYYQSGGVDYSDYTPIPMNPKELSKQTIDLIKRSYLTSYNEEKQDQDTLLTMDMIDVIYYGTYNGAVAVKIYNKLAMYPDVMKSYTIDDVTFNYSGSVITMWK